MHLPVELAVHQGELQVARLLGRERNPHRHTPRAYAPALIGYTTKRDAICG
ncbi:hypothetical protein [Streptomyces sp. NPDC059378]|uniref:hypothetical protein n=1 Tax=Streptomyces sp. NPDC059378 TaxID=3346815 RepID=UPI0036818F41